MNKWLFKLHSTVALFACVPLLVICVTGSILVFKMEIDAWLSGPVFTVTPGEERLSMDVLLDNIDTALPTYEVVGWMLPEERNRSDRVYVIEQGSSDWSYLHLDPYSGSIVSYPLPHDHFLTDWLVELHYTFLLHEAGMVVTALFAVLLMFLGITGLILHRKFWKNFFTLRWGSRLVVYFSDLHKFVGVISAPILLVLGFTGVWWNVVDLLHEMEEHADGHEHHVMEASLYSDRISLDALQREAESSIDGFRTTYISLPWEPGLDVTFWGEVPSANFLSSSYSSTVTFDAQSGERLATYDIRQQGLGANIVDSYGALHYGNFGGIASKLLWCVLGAAPALLAVTGLTLWWRRRPQRKRKKLKRRRAEALPG